MKILVITAALVLQVFAPMTIPDELVEDNNDSVNTHIIKEYSNITFGDKDTLTRIHLKDFQAIAYASLTDGTLYIYKLDLLFSADNLLTEEYISTEFSMYITIAIVNGRLVDFGLPHLGEVIKEVVHKTPKQRRI